MNGNNKTFYVTTPIYYPSNKLHIGHSYTTVAADTIARYKKLRGFDVKFLTGTDEHGQKIERVAAEKGVTPKQYVDEIVSGIKVLWKLMNIEYDTFIRTTDEYHEKAVQKIFKQLYEQGDIYKSSYEGLYCTQCETFYTDRQVSSSDGKCPDCGRGVERVREDAYFFRLSKYQDRLIKLLESSENAFLEPQSRRNEMINNFLKPGLEDLCVSRTSFKWGVPVDFDPDHVVYVWIDALSNYITALGFYSDDDSEFKKYWPADVHLMAKEIVRFHSIIWPAMLMALNQDLPKRVFGHGWILFDGGKMSKSKGNVIDPVYLVNKYGVDSIRYYLMREMSFGQDGNFTNEALLQRINSDLANDLGNLLSRTVGMIEKYFNGGLPEIQENANIDTELSRIAKDVFQKTTQHLDNLCFSDALSEIWILVRRANKYIDETSPWILAKDESKKARLAAIMYNLAEVLRITGILISPFMPNTAPEIFKQLNITDSSVKTWDSAEIFGSLPKTVSICKGNIVFPRIDIKKELLEMEQFAEAASGKATASSENQDGTKPSDAQKTAETKEAGGAKPQIDISDFAKVELKVGKVLECYAVEGSDKLLKSIIAIGGEKRQIVSGIAKHYSPEQMVGKSVIVVTNLKPVKLRGVLSEGMILAASDDAGNLKAVTIDGDITDGACVS